MHDWKWPLEYIASPFFYTQVRTHSHAPAAMQFDQQYAWCNHSIRRTQRYNYIAMHALVALTFAISTTFRWLRGVLDAAVRSVAALKCTSSVTGEIKIAESPRVSSLK